MDLNKFLRENGNLIKKNKNPFKNWFFFKLVWVIFFLIKHKGYFEIWVEKSPFYKDFQLDMQDEGDYYFYTSISSLIKEIYEYNYYND